MKSIAHFLSTILHPLLMPTYGIFLLTLYPIYIRLGARMSLFIISIVALTTLLVPALGIVSLYLLKVIKSISLYNRRERFYPYIITLICYAFCGFLLYKLKLPAFFIGFMAGCIVSLIIDLIVTSFWKISAHMTGIGGLLAVVTIIYKYFDGLNLPFLLSTILLVGLLGTSRMYLKCHNLGQVIAGTLNGLLSIYILIYFSFELFS